MGFLLAQMEKKLSAMQDTLVQSLGWDDTLERGMATHSGILTWRIPWTEEPGYSPWGHRVGHNCGTKHTSVSNPTKYNIGNYNIIKI